LSADGGSHGTMLVVIDTFVGSITAIVSG